MSERVLVLHWGRNGGGPKFALEMAEGLLTLGVDTFTSLNVEVRPQQTTHDFPVRTYSSEVGLVVGLPRLALVALRLRRFIRVNGITLVYSPMLSIWQSLAIWLIIPPRISYAASIHDAYDHPGERHVLKSLARWLEFSRADFVVTYSTTVGSEVRGQMRRRSSLVVVPHGVDVIDSAARTISEQQSPIVVGFLGRIVEYKGIDVFVEAIDIARRTNPSIRGSVHGMGDVPEELISRSGSYIDWNIEWIAEDQLHSIAATFDIIALPYKEASQSGIMTIALANAIPVVATPVGGLTEQVQTSRGGLLSGDTTSGSFASAINRLADDPALYARLSREGLATARESMSWTASATEMLNSIDAARDH